MVKDDLSKKFFEILAEFGKELEQDLIESLRDKKVTGSGGQDSTLAGSIEFKVTNKPSIIFTMNDYWEWVENGRKKGKNPPIDKLIEWIKWKGIKPSLYNKAKDKAVKGLKGHARKQARESAYEKSVKSLAFAIANSIAKHGTIKRFNYKGSKFIDAVLKDNRLERLTNRIADEIGIEIEVILSDKFKDNGNK